MKTTLIILLSLFTLVGYGQGVTTSYQKQTNITEMTAVRYAQISDFKIKGDMVTYIDSIQFDEYGEPKYMWAGVNKYIVLPYPEEGSGIEEGITFGHGDPNQSITFGHGDPNQSIEIIVDTIDTIWKSYDGRSIKIQDLIDYQEYCKENRQIAYYMPVTITEYSFETKKDTTYNDATPVYSNSEEPTFNGFIEWMKNKKQ